MYKSIARFRRNQEYISIFLCGDISHLRRFHHRLIVKLLLPLFLKNDDYRTIEKIDTVYKSHYTAAFIEGKAVPV